MKKKKVLIALIIGGLLLACSLYVVANKKNVEKKTQSTIKTHADSGHYFTINIPSSWTTKETIGTEKTEIGTPHEKTNELEITNLYNGKGAGVNIQVYKRIPSCKEAKKPNTTIAGLPAFYNASFGIWTINTTEGIYVINYGYPGIPTFGSNHKNPQPASPAITQQYKLLISKIIYSFHPAFAIPLNCPSK